ncbi:hypothetical protein Spa11_00660 [Botrimarina mediterranea]|uniref:Uncharacterized protein n=2 Tax=Botrimarina mediterranea TaxID=2528022 RepID=A0A518K296_9BACT|nr:hypothetical protein Spa11_00660 [Botrimarina mediterranea]
MLSQLPDEGSSKPIPLWQIAPAIEFVCWVVVGLAPLLYVIIGAPVTSDQAVLQVSIVVLAVLGAILMRVIGFRNSRGWKELLVRLEEEEVT